MKKENSDERNETTSREENNHYWNATKLCSFERGPSNCVLIVFRANSSNGDHNAVNGGQSYSFKNKPDFCCKCDNR